MSLLFQIALGLVPAILILAIGLALRRFSRARAIPLLALFCCVSIACGVLGAVRLSGAPSPFPVPETHTVLELAQAVAGQGDPSLAQALLKQATREEAESAQAVLCLARTYALQGNAPGASALYRKAMALDPNIDAAQELNAAQQAAMPGPSDPKATAKLAELAAEAVDEAAALAGDGITSAARILQQIEERYALYLTSGHLDESQLRRLSRQMDSLSEEQPTLFVLTPVRLARLKVNILREDYRDIARNVDENSSYDELLVVSELYLNGYIRRQNFDSGYGAEHADQCAAVAEQVQKLYENYYRSQNRTIRKAVQAYIDSLKSARRDPAMVQIKSSLLDYARMPGAQDSSKVYLQLAKLENSAGNSSQAEQYLTASLGSAGDCLDSNYTQPMYEIISILADKDDPERLKDVAGYVDRILTNSAVIQMPENLARPAEETGVKPLGNAAAKPLSNTADGGNSTGFNSFVTDFVSQKRSALNVAQVDPSNFPEISASIGISTSLALSDEELAGHLTVRDCGTDITDFTLERVEYDQVNVLLCCDVSGSMGGQAIEDLRQAVKLFAGSLERSQNLALVTFSSSVQQVYGFDSDPADILRAADGLWASGGTDMYSACLYSMDLFQPSKDTRNVIILLSDGEDNTRRSEDTLYNSLAKRAGEQQVTLYTIGLGSSVDSGYLSTMAGMCGGTYMYVDNSQTLNSFYEYLNGLMFSQYRLRYTARDTLRTTRQLHVSVADDLYCQDTANYYLGGSGESGDLNGSGAVNPLPDVEISGFDTRLLFKGSKSQEIRLLGSGLKEELAPSLVIKGSVDYELKAEYESDSSWKVTVPAGVACGEYDLYVTIEDKTAVLDRELIIAVQGQERSVAFGPYVFTAFSVVRSQNNTTLSGLVTMNGWLRFRGDVTLAGDLDGSSVLMSTADRAYVQYYEGSSQGLASLFAKKNWKLDIPSLGQRRLYNDPTLDPAGEKYPVDTTPIPALYVVNTLTLAAPGMGLYPDRLEIRSDAFTTAFPLQEQLLKKAKLQDPYSFEHSITGKLTATQIGIAAKFTLGHNDNAYYPVNFGSMPLYLDPANVEVELDTLEQKYSLDFTIRLGFLGSTDDGAGLKLAWNGSLFPDEVGVNIDHDLTTNISGVPITFSDFYFGVKDMTGNKPIDWTLTGKATASAYKIDVLLPGIGEWFGDISVCSLDAGAEFSLGQTHLLLKGDFKLFEEIRLAGVELEAGRFNYDCWLLNMDQQAMTGMRAKLDMGVQWESSNCDIDIGGSVELVLAPFDMLGVAADGTFSVEVQWWVFQKEIRADGAAVLGMYMDHSNQPVFILKAVSSGGRKNATVMISWSKNTGIETEIKL